MKEYDNSKFWQDRGALISGQGISWYNHFGKLAVSTNTKHTNTI